MLFLGHESLVGEERYFAIIAWRQPESFRVDVVERGLKAGLTLGLNPVSDSNREPLDFHIIVWVYVGWLSCG